MIKARTLFTLPILATLILLIGHSAQSRAQSSYPSPKPCEVFGNVRLEGLYHAAVGQQVIFELTPFRIMPFRQVSKSTITLTCWIRAEGRCGFTIPAGLYIVHIKGAKWLSATEILDARNPHVTFETTLLGGDLNNDNCVDKADWEIVNDALSSKPSKSEWDYRADSNCDGVVDKTDLQIVEQNLGLFGW